MPPPIVFPLHGCFDRASFQHGKKANEQGQHLSGKHQCPSQCGADPVHLAHEGQNDDPHNGATEDNLQVRAAPFVRRLSLGTPDQNHQGQDDGEEQNHSHVTKVPM